MFQIALTKDFKIPVEVSFGQLDSEPDVMMVRQTTLDEWDGGYHNMSSTVPPKWVQIKITISARIIKDVETLTDSYTKLHEKIAENLKGGEVFYESSF